MKFFMVIVYANKKVDVYKNRSTIQVNSIANAAGRVLKLRIRLKPFWLASMKAKGLDI